MCNSHNKHNIYIYNKNKVIKKVNARHKNIIICDNLEFKDLNDNGILDEYEDWRLSSEQRASNLISQMTLEEKAGMMVINSQLTAVGQKNSEYISEDGLLNEESASNEMKIYLNYVGNTETISELNIRHIISRENISSEQLAKWTNAIQELAEKSRLGIPVVVASNPRNSLTMPRFNKNSETVNTMYPSTLGIAAAAMGEERFKGKTDIIKNFSEIVKEEFLESGIRKGYMYTADIMTDPRWLRNSETFGEDEEFVSRVISTIVTTMQGENKLSDNGVALTVKHFPGSGARKNGIDAHFESGKYSPYNTKNSLSTYHLKPFESAINSGVSSIMPYYSLPDPNSATQEYNGYEIKMDGSAYSYNEEFLTELLRNQMGFNGYINTDSGIIDFIYWGEEGKTNEEKVAKAINSGVDLISDTNNVQWIINAVNDGMLSEDRVNESVKRLLIEMFDLGIFENPYTDINEENDNLDRIKEKNDEAYSVHQKSVVLLKNDNVLPIKTSIDKKYKVYIKSYSKQIKLFKEKEMKELYNFEVTDDYNEADYFITYFYQDVGYINKIKMSLKELIGNEYDEWINISNNIRDRGGKTITVVDFSTAYILDGVEEYSDCIIGGFNTYITAILDVIVGKVSPTGVLPFTLPASNEVLKIDEKGNCVSPNDVPGYDKTLYMKDLKYEYVDTFNNSYKCGFGLTF